MHFLHQYIQRKRIVIYKPDLESGGLVQTCSHVVTREHVAKSRLDTGMFISYFFDNVRTSERFLRDTLKFFE